VIHLTLTQLALVGLAGYLAGVGTVGWFFRGDIFH
jgi:hypothetical protein